MTGSADIAETERPEDGYRVPKLRFPEFRDAGGWDETTIGNISRDVIAGGTPSTNELKYWNGNIRWMNSGELNNKIVNEVHGRITEFGLKKSSTRQIPKYCILIGLAGQGKTRGTVAINMIELCTNQSIAAIFPNDSLFHSFYLYHDLDNRYEELRSLSAGGEGRGGLNLQIIKALKVYLPNLGEQKKIADCLSTLDELISAQTQKLEALKVHKIGLMQQLFPAEGETVPKLRFPEFRDAGGWEVKPLIELCSRITQGGTPDTSNPQYWNGKIEWLTPAEMGKSENRFVHSTARRISQLGLSNCSSELLPIGSVIISVRAPIGHLAINISKMAINQGCKGLIPNVNTNTNFLYYMLLFYKPALIDLGAGNTFKELSSSSLKNFNIASPELAEQQRIADCLTSLDELVSAQTQKLEALKEHKKGLMQQLFPTMNEAKP